MNNPQKKMGFVLLFLQPWEGETQASFNLNLAFFFSWKKTPPGPADSFSLC